MNLKNKKIFRTIQIIVGLYILFAAISGFFQFIPPPEFNEAATQFMTALFATGYMFYFMSIIFLISGITFIFNKWSAFGAILLAPITANIVLFHIFLDTSGWWLAFIFTLLHVYILTYHWPQYKPMFSKK